MGVIGKLAQYGVTVSPEGLLSVNGQPVNQVGIGGGKVYYVDPANGSDNRDGLSPATARASILSAYNSCTDGNNDTVVYIGGSSSITLSAALVWSKSYTHLVGLCAPTQVAQRCRIFQLSSLTGASPLLTISGSGCIFANFYIFQGVADATSLINVSVTGSRNYFSNVHFAGGGHATQAVDGGASLHINGGSENTFDNCTIGVDTATQGNGYSALLYAATGGAARNIFNDCRFSVYAGHAGVRFVEALGNSGLDRYHEFNNCKFVNLSTTAMDSAFEIAGGFDASSKRFILDNDCYLLGADDWDDNDSGVVFSNLGTFTAGGNAGIMTATLLT